MGRKKKFLTEKSKRKAQNAYAMSYYERNKEEIKKKAKKKYHASKRNNLQDDELN